MEKFKSHFTKAINDKKNNTGTLKAARIANGVKEQVDPNKENQRILAQATVEANEKKPMKRLINLKNKQRNFLLH